MVPRTFVGFVAAFPTNRGDDDAPAGEELALFVAAQMRNIGFDVRGPKEHEGWAWDITTHIDDVEIDTIVGLVGDMDSVPPRQWLITNDARISLWNRLFNATAAKQKRESSLKRFCTSLHKTLDADPRVSHILWYDPKTFDKPGDEPAASP